PAPPDGAVTRARIFVNSPVSGKDRGRTQGRATPGPGSTRGPRCHATPGSDPHPPSSSAGSAQPDTPPTPHAAGPSDTRQRQGSSTPTRATSPAPSTAEPTTPHRPDSPTGSPTPRPV